MPVIGEFGFVILALADHMAQFHAFQGSPGGLETLESQHRPGPSFDAPVILFYKVVEVFGSGLNLLYRMDIDSKFNFIDQQANDNIVHSFKF